MNHDSLIKYVRNQLAHLVGKQVIPVGGTVPLTITTVNVYNNSISIDTDGIFMRD